MGNALAIKLAQPIPCIIKSSIKKKDDMVMTTFLHIRCTIGTSRQRFCKAQRQKYYKLLLCLELNISELE